MHANLKFHFPLPLEAQWTALLLGLAVLLGGTARFLPGIQAGFPINDGGMFYVMTQELMANGFALPLSTGYNGLGIPYAYPPLGFYAAGLMSALTGADLLDIFRFLPAAVSTLCIPLVYLLARDLTGEAPLAALAALFYALLPRSFIFLVMGGGVTRAWGHLFLLGMAWLALRAFKHPAPRRTALAGLAGGLVILSHPETAVHAAAFGLVTWLVYGRSRQGTRTAALIAAGAALTSLPWWGLMLARHGPEPYLSIFSTSARGGWNILLWYFTNFSEEPFLPVLTVLSAVGLLVALGWRQFYLPLLVVFTLLASQRSAATPIMIPTAILAALAWARVILPGLAQSPGGQAGYAARPARILLGVITLYALTGALYMAGSLFRNFALTAPQRAAFAQAAASLPANARVLVLSGRSQWQNDPAQEWFPALTGRASLATVQGREWTPGLDFADFGGKVNHLQTHCPLRDAACLHAALAALGAQPPVYIYADLPALRANLGLPEDAHMELQNWIWVHNKSKIIVQDERFFLSLIYSKE